MDREDEDEQRDTMVHDEDGDGIRDLTIDGEVQMKVSVKDSRLLHARPAESLCQPALASRDAVAEVRHPLRVRHLLIAPHARSNATPLWLSFGAKRRLFNRRSPTH